MSLRNYGPERIQSIRIASILYVSFMKSIKEILWSSPVLREVYIYWSEKARFLHEAKIRFPVERTGNGSIDDYKRALSKHRVTYSEYMYSYEYWRLDEEQRNEFISTSEMQCIYRKFGSKKVRDLFHDKVSFLKEYNGYVHREWALTKDLSLDEFKGMVLRKDWIAKPVDRTRGEGIFKISSKDVQDWDSLFSRCVDGNILLEECVYACKEIATFHPQSLNTIRVVTFSNKEKCIVFGALLRTGAHGSFIDNTHAGGVYAPIDVETGIVNHDGIDSKGNIYYMHPDSGLIFKGFQIPKWKEIITTCQKASSQIPDVFFAGWDVCVLENGSVELIEGNHAPDFDGGMQAPFKIGVKKCVKNAFIELYGVDPIDYLPWYRRPYKR